MSGVTGRLPAQGDLVAVNDLPGVVHEGESLPSVPAFQSAAGSSIAPFLVWPDSEGQGGLCTVLPS